MLSDKQMSGVRFLRSTAMSVSSSRRFSSGLFDQVTASVDDHVESIKQDRLRVSSMAFSPSMIADGLGEPICIIQLKIGTLEVVNTIPSKHCNFGSAAGIDLAD